MRLPIRAAIAAARTTPRAAQSAAPACRGAVTRAPTVTISPTRPATNASHHPDGDAAASATPRSAQVARPARSTMAGVGGVRAPDASRTRSTTPMTSRPPPAITATPRRRRTPQRSGAVRSSQRETPRGGRTPATGPRTSSSLSRLAFMVALPSTGTRRRPFAPACVAASRLRRVSRPPPPRPPRRRVPGRGRSFPRGTRPGRSGLRPRSADRSAAAGRGGR